MPLRAAEIHRPMIPRYACRAQKPRMMESKMLTWLHMYQKEVLHSIRTAAAAVGFSVDRAILPIAGVLLGRRYRNRHHAINSWRRLDRLEAALCGHRARRRAIR